MKALEAVSKRSWKAVGGEGRGRAAAGSDGWAGTLGPKMTPLATALTALEVSSSPRDAAREGIVGSTPWAAGAAMHGTRTRRKTMPETASIPAVEASPKRSTLRRWMSAQSWRSGAGTCSTESRMAASVPATAWRSAVTLWSRRVPRSLPRASPSREGSISKALTASVGEAGGAGAAPSWAPTWLPATTRSRASEPASAASHTKRTGGASTAAM